MTIPIKEISASHLICSNCKAACCQLEVLLITETGVPERFIKHDQWGGETMQRLDDGWCVCVDRETLLCTIYENRPWVCREFEMSSYECSIEFIACNPAIDSMK